MMANGVGNICNSRGNGVESACPSAAKTLLFENAIFEDAAPQRIAMDENFSRQDDNDGMDASWKSGLRRDVAASVQHHAIRGDDATVAHGSQ